jgi:hypothetical protein
MPPCFSRVKPVQSSLSPKHEKLVMMSPHKTLPNRIQFTMSIASNRAYHTERREGERKHHLKGSLCPRVLHLGKVTSK